MDKGGAVLHVAVPMLAFKTPYLQGKKCYLYVTQNRYLASYIKSTKN